MSGMGLRCRCSPGCSCGILPLFLYFWHFIILNCFFSLVHLRVFYLYIFLIIFHSHNPPSFTDHHCSVFHLQVSTIDCRNNSHPATIKPNPATNTIINRKFMLKKILVCTNSSPSKLWYHHPKRRQQANRQQQFEPAHDQTDELKIKHNKIIGVL